MRDRLVMLLASGLGVGYLPGAPGTWGSVVGLGYWWLLYRSGNAAVYAVVLLLGLAFAVWCAGAAARIRGEPDPSCVVIDEWMCVPLALAGTGWDWRLVALGFLLFRVLDVWKPGPIRRLQRWPGGWGIVADDVAAALGACAITRTAAWILGRM